MIFAIEDARKNPSASEFSARTYFLQVSNEIDQTPLRELYDDVWALHREGQDITDRSSNWCRRWNLLHDGEPAAWVLGHIRLTVIWWERGKPNPEQYLTGKHGGLDPEPLEWFPLVERFGRPTLLLQGQASPWEHVLTFNLTRRDDELKRDYTRRLRREHRDSLKDLLVAVEKASSIWEKLQSTDARQTSFKEHMLWTVKYQMCKTSISKLICGNADSYRRTVDKAISQMLSSIGLSRRPPTSTTRLKKAEDHQ